MWLARNPEIGNTSASVLPNIWRLKLVRDTKFGTDVSNKKLLHDAKCLGYSFYHFWDVKTNLKGGVKDYNAKVDGKNFLDQPINNYTETYEDIRKLILVRR